MPTALLFELRSYPQFTYCFKNDPTSAGDFFALAITEKVAVIFCGLFFGFHALVAEF
jgi:hypothetical protein